MQHLASSSSQKTIVNVRLEVVRPVCGIASEIHLLGAWLNARLLWLILKEYIHLFERAAESKEEREKRRDRALSFTGSLLQLAAEAGAGSG